MQKSIQVKKVEYGIQERQILKGVSFTCTERERICIFGENGAGKSTLLKIICGEIEPDAGVVQKNGHIRFVYVPQEFSEESKVKTVSEYITAVFAGAKISAPSESLYKKIFGFAKQLGFPLESRLEKICGSMSGGQQKIVAISTALALSPDYILLDEPENHLDIVSRMALIELLQEFRGAILFISHDRLLIDNIATKVAELAGGMMHISEGGYDDYIEMKMARIGGLQREFDAEAKRIKQLTASIGILAAKAFRGKEVSAYKKAKEELAELKAAHNQSGRPDLKSTKIKLQGTESRLHNGKLLCKVRDLGFKYPEAKGKIFDRANLEVRSGDRIVLLGRNGSGKSTFLKCLTKKEVPVSGEVVWADGVKWSYFDQHAEFDQDLSALEIVCRHLNLDDTDGRAALGAMRFDTHRMTTASKHLSGGERMRIRFALAFGAKPDFIILDEPTNHIDEVTWEILLEVCQKTKSSILLVTHDYEFIKAFDPGIFWLIHGQTIAVRYKDLDELLGEIR